jgi:hypothetical protein
MNKAVGKTPPSELFPPAKHVDGISLGHHPGNDAWQVGGFVNKGIHPVGIASYTFVTRTGENPQGPGDII